MAELVDALVSNTSGVKSIPVRSRVWVQRTVDNPLSISRFFLLLGSQKREKNGSVEIYPLNFY